MMNRQQLQEAYVNRVLDDMDVKDAYALLFDFLNNDLDKCSENELIEEVEHFYPDLIEE